VKIAIVNDSLIVMEGLRRILSTAPEHEVIWTASNGADAVSRCLTSTPDLILMDLLMPVMDGVEATRRIMAQSKCAILIVTAGVSQRRQKVYEAMGHGALDAVDTPFLGPNLDTGGAAELLTKITTISKLIGKNASIRSGAQSAGEARGLPSRAPYLVAIGASTGGPPALATVLSQLPKDCSAAVVIVQHVDVQFSAQLVDWLGQSTPLPVRIAQQGAYLKGGEVVVAGTNDHLVLRANLTLAYTPDPVDYPYRPSVDVFFRSLAQHWPNHGAGVVLTGMGADGAAGLKELRALGWHTITQDRLTSAVWGMPKVAAENGAAIEILPLEKIGIAIVRTIT